LALGRAAARLAGAALRRDAEAPFDDFFADFLEAEALALLLAFAADLAGGRAADFLEDFAADLPLLFFAEDFFALFFDAAIWFLLFKRVGGEPYFFDERTSAASCNTVYELHEIQCRRT
jgi:hypothetical protein